MNQGFHPRKISWFEWEGNRDHKLAEISRLAESSATELQHKTVISTINSCRCTTHSHSIVLQTDVNDQCDKLAAD